MAITDEDIGYLVQQRLRAASAINALVAGRIRPDALVENEIMPAIRYEIVATTPWTLLSGAMTEQQTRLQVDCYGATRTQANTVAAAVKSNLHGFSGSIGSLVVHDCVMDNRYDRRDPPEPGGKQWRPRRTMDFVISHTEPAPTLS